MLAIIYKTEEILVYLQAGARARAHDSTSVFKLTD